MILFLSNIKRFFFKSLKQPGYALKVLFKRLKAFFYYWFGDGRSSYPEAITLFLTHRCNLHCKMCGQWGEGGVTKKKGTEEVRLELSLEELKAFIDEVAYFAPNITLFGGEPLLYPGCVEAIKHIKQRGLHCLMITNGSLLENFAEDLVKSGLDELNLSLDGDAILHDHIRGMPGLFDQIMRGLKKLQLYKQQLGKKKPLLNLQCTINQENYLNLEQLLDVAKVARADSLTFHHLIFLTPQVLKEQKKYDNLLGCTSSDWEGFVFPSGIDAEALYALLQKIKGRNNSFSVDVYPSFSCAELKAYYNQATSSVPVKLGRCLSPWVTLYVFPDAEVRPCLNSSYSYGNIKEVKFSKLWNGEQARKFRQALKKNKIFPVCPRCTELYRY